MGKKNNTGKPVVGLETSGEEITPTADVGSVEELGFVEGTSINDTDGAESTTTLVDAEQLETIKEGDAVVEPINPDDVPEQDKVSSVAQVMDRAVNDSRVDTTVGEAIDTEPVIPTDIPEPEEVVTVGDINAIIKRDDIGLLEKVELVAKALGGVAGSVITSLLALYTLGSKAATRQPDPMNREQRALVRFFIRLSTQTTDEQFNHGMKYINWVYKQLTDEKLLDKEQLTLVRGVSPLDPSNSSIFIAGKDDKDLITFNYLITIIDVKANAKTPSEKTRKIDISKATVNTLLTAEMVTRLNNYYTA